MHEAGNASVQETDSSKIHPASRLAPSIHIVDSASER